MLSRDSIVRVEVSRLRQRLARYYDTEGADEVSVSCSWNPATTPSSLVELQQDQRSPKTRALRPKWSNPSRRERAAYPSTAEPGWRLRLWPLWWLPSSCGLSCAVPGRAQPARTVPPVSSSVPSAVPVVPGEEGVRISVGVLEPKYVDSSGHVWTGDRYFTRGRAVIRQGRRSLPHFGSSALRESPRGRFPVRYSPRDPALYELHLHFSEILYNETLDSSGVGVRRFNCDPQWQDAVESF